MAKVRYSRATNLKVRAYAAEHGFTLGDIAKHLELSQSQFSSQYMARELVAEEQEMLCKAVDEMALKGA